MVNWDLKEGGGEKKEEVITSWRGDGIDKLIPA